MSELGFQPVCVMYQGNDSPLDGTYRLVCRHQIREDNFLPDDFIHVEALSTTGERESRQAIVMGDDLVSTLVRSLYPAPAPVQTPTQLSMRHMKNGQNDEQVMTNKERDCLRQVLATVRDIKTEVLRQGQELSQIKWRQIQLETKMGLMQELIAARCSIKDNSSEGKGNDCKKTENRALLKPAPRESVPVVSNLVEVVTETGESYFTNWHADGHTSTQSVPMDEKSAPRGNAEQKGAPIKQKRGKVDFVSDNKEGYLAYIYNKAHSSSEVTIGNSRFSLTIGVGDLEDMVYRTHSVESFAFRLTEKCFSHEEMLEGNTRGGGLRADGGEYKRFNPAAVQMIIREVKKRFEFAEDDRTLVARGVRDGVNKRARSERKRLITREKAIMRRNLIKKHEKVSDSSSEDQD